METALRPLTLGEILDRTAQLYRSNFLLFAGIASVYAGALLALSLLQIAVQEWLRTHHMATELIWAGIAGAIITFPIIIICSGFAIAANNRAVAWLYLGQPATIRGAYRSILPRLGRYLWLMTVTTFRVWAPCALVYAGLLCFMVFYAKPKGILAPAGHVSDSQLYIVFVAVVGVFCILLLGAFIYAALMGLRYSLAVPACVIEDIKARAAIRRSVQLSKGARGRIFLLGLLVVAVDSGLVLITQAFFLFAAVKYHGQLPAGMRALQQVVAFFTNTFVGPIYATGFTLFYYDQRVRNEGFDIEWMMRAAGMDAPPPSHLPEPSALSEPAALPLAAAPPEQAHE